MMSEANQSRENAAVGELIPSLKRKRRSEGHLESPIGSDTEKKTCFTNAAFSSTPKKVVARRRGPITIPNNFIQNSCLEVKSIADIVKGAKDENKTGNTQSQNPYEVVRKPPKKKKRETELNEACFENAALNLELPEKQFNPYEVLREIPVNSIKTTQPKCFVNKALNLRTQDVIATRNPFEIHRCADGKPKEKNAGVKNHALDAEPISEPTNLKIALPFKPNLGCRIDFSNIPIEQLTPSKLLADKLVFSPVLAVPKRSLDSASEESSMDIGRELDRYQLELENSINEAKMRKALSTDIQTKNTTTELTLQLDVEQRITFNQRLAEIAEEDEEYGEDKENENSNEDKFEHIEGTIQQTETEYNEEKQLEVRVSEEHEDVTYASDSDEDELDLKAPAPFVRAYQRSSAPQVVGSKESLHSTGSVDLVANNKKYLNVRNIIRKSIRKLIQSNKTEAGPKKSEHSPQIEEMKEKEKEKQHTSAYKIIRNSLRRKASIKVMPTTQQQQQKMPVLAKTDISIIDTSERTMKLKTNNLPDVDNVERKHTLCNSFRRSTREMGQHLMKTVFHKNQEAYELSK